MAVPNTTTFTLQDVTTEIYGDITSGRNLTSCFTDANGSFDSNYVGSKNALYNFRNYSNTRSNFGYLYNGFAYNNSLFAPSGWHVPSRADLDTLINTVNTTIGGKKLKSTSLDYWIDNVGTDDYGFTCYGSGWRDDAGAFNGVRSWAHLGSTAKSGIYMDTLRLFHNIDSVAVTQVSQLYGNPIRLIKDNSTNPGTVTDIDGNVYGCVTIGSQVWTTSNFKSTRLRDGTSIPTVTNATTWSGLTTLAKCAYNNDLGYI